MGSFLNDFMITNNFYTMLTIGNILENPVLEEPFDETLEKIENNQNTSKYIFSTF